MLPAVAGEYEVVCWQNTDDGDQDDTRSSAALAVFQCWPPFSAQSLKEKKEKMGRRAAQRQRWMAGNGKGGATARKTVRA